MPCRGDRAACWKQGTLSAVGLVVRACGAGARLAGLWRTQDCRRGCAYGADNIPWIQPAHTYTGDASCLHGYRQLARHLGWDKPRGPLTSLYNARLASLCSSRLQRRAARASGTVPGLGGNLPAAEQGRR